MLVRYSLTHLETISQSITCYKFSVCKVGRTLVRKFFDEPCCHARQSCASQREGTSIQQEEQQNKKFLTTWSLTTLHGMFTVWPIYRQWIAFFFHPVPGNYTRMYFIGGNRSTKNDPGLPWARLSRVPSAIHRMGIVLVRNDYPIHDLHNI